MSAAAVAPRSVLTDLRRVFQMEGMMRVILEPLIGDAPLVGGVTFFFIRRPVSAEIHDLDWHQSRLPFHNNISECLIIF